jgi:hypothetical protein
MTTRCQFQRANGSKRSRLAGPNHANRGRARNGQINVHFQKSLRVPPCGVQIIPLMVESPPSILIIEPRGESGTPQVAPSPARSNVGEGRRVQQRRPRNSSPSLSAGATFAILELT